MKIDILEEGKKIIDAGVKTSAGFTSPKANKRTLTAQFPSERASGNDSNGYYINDLYNNGLLFTAYDYSSRTTGSLRDFRKGKNKAQGFGQTLGAFGINIDFGRNTRFDSDAVANILLPRSQTDVDAVSHKFNDVGESLVSKGGGTVGGALSNMASSAVFGSLESITGGYLADKGEQIYNTARSMYAGADARSKTYVWNLTPRSIEDLRNILIIYETFVELSYGSSGVSSAAKQLKTEVDNWYKNTLLDKTTPKGSDKSGTIFSGITDFLSNVVTVSNPTIWMISSFGKRSAFEGRNDSFGPAQITSVRLDKSSDGKFNGLAISPNLPSSFMLEVSFREILTLSRGTIFGGS